METVAASVMWDGPKRDIVCIFREPTPSWTIDPLEDNVNVNVLIALDDEENETGEIAGIEILDFLAFNDWKVLPDFPITWKVGGAEPLPLPDLLKRLQQEFRRQAKAGAA